MNPNQHADFWWWAMILSWTAVVVWLLRWLWVKVGEADREIDFQEQLREAQALDYEDEPLPPAA